MLDGYWLVPRFTMDGHPLGPMVPFLEKPPLAMWFQAGAMAIGGETPVVARIPSVLITAAMVSVAVLLAWRIASPLVAFGTGGLLLISKSLYGTHAANNVATDPYLLFFGILAIYLLVLLVKTEDARWAWLSGAAYGLAILSKGVAAAPFGLFVLPFLMYYWEQVGWSTFGKIVLGGILTAAPWFAIVSLIVPEQLFDQMIYTQVVQRSTGERYVGTSSALFSFMRYPYFQVAPTYFRFTSYLFPIAVLGAAYRFTRDGIRDVDILGWPLLFGVIFLYAFVGGNHKWYLLPATVPLAWVTATGFLSIWEVTATALFYDDSASG
jgi:4-amino-4-deoxy-L-arabinose transferase-like glycosyltransferase